MRCASSRRASRPGCRSRVRPRSRSHISRATEPLSCRLPLSSTGPCGAAEVRMPPTMLSSPVEPSTAPTTRSVRIVLALAAVELVILFAPTVEWLYERWTMSVWHNAHGLFVPPVVGYLVYEELRRAPAASRAPSALGFAFLVPALLLHALDAGMHTQLLSAIALVLALPG